MPSPKKVRVAAVADVHCTKSSHDTLQPLFAEMAEKADVLALCGDLTDYGLPDEAHVLAKELAAVKAPVVAVLGNHDFESGHHDEVREILCDAGVALLDGESHEVLGVGFAGAKGFAGGFGRRALPFWGEAACKRFVQEAIDEALKLENALARLSTSQRIVLLHYSPIQATVEGEPPEIYAWMGSSRLEEPLSRYPVTAVFHGHAHHGAPEGKTHGDSPVPVYNVSLPLMRHMAKDGAPLFRVLELPVEIGARAAAHAA
ncbi:MAG TPA: metallophosphoesterase [Chloroflexota bacterium]|jgi:Icc-related predicted phosphoesterase|nr:metallophosphoesterase [Chloroflexota bacterium]